MLTVWLLVAWASIGLSFVKPTYCAWLMVLGLGVLIHFVSLSRYHIQHALVATGTLLVVFIIPLCSVLLHFFYVSGVALFVAGLGFFLALHLWLWFVCIDIICRYHWLGIVLITGLFWWFVRNYFFWWMGMCYGLPIIHPLVVLMVYKPVRFLVSCMGIEVTLFTLIFLVTGVIYSRHHLVKAFFFLHSGFFVIFPVR